MHKHKQLRSSRRARQFELIVLESLSTWRICCFTSLITDKLTCVFFCRKISIFQLDNSQFRCSFILALRGKISLNWVKCKTSGGTWHQHNHVKTGNISISTLPHKFIVVWARANVIVLQLNAWWYDYIPWHKHTHTLRANESRMRTFYVLIRQWNHVLHKRNLMNYETSCWLHFRFYVHIRSLILCTVDYKTNS